MILSDSSFYILFDMVPMLLTASISLEETMLIMCHMSCVFYGPVQLVGNTPFTVLEHEHVKKVFLLVYLQKQ